MKPEEKWGQGFYGTLSRNLRQSLPDAKGFLIGISTICTNFMNFFLFWKICNKLLHKLGKMSFLPKMKSRN